MLPYVILIVFPILLSIIRFTTTNTDIKPENNNQSFSICIFFVILSILVMFRSQEIGNDTRNYMNFFLRYASMEWKELGRDSMEIGFQILNKVISLLSNDPRVFLIITTILICLMMVPTYLRLCVDTPLTVVLFCSMSTFAMMFSGVRQMLAVGAGFIAYEFTRRRKLLFFILTVLLATSIHTSAFMLAFMYPLYNTKINRKTFMLLIPIFVGIMVFNKPIFRSLGNILIQFTDYQVTETSTGAYTMLILFVLFTLFAFIIPDENQLDAETYGLRNFLLISLIVQMLAPLNFVAMRMNYYYIIYIPLLLPRVIKNRKKEYTKVAILARYIMIVFFLLYFFVNANHSNKLHIYPYEFFWEA